MVLFMVIWLKGGKKEWPHKQMKSHKESESVNFMTILSFFFCREGNRNPTNVAVINRQKKKKMLNIYSNMIWISL